MTAKTVRLKATPIGSRGLATFDRVTVDRSGNGSINGASVITAGPALGHGFDVDAETIAQVAKHFDGLPGRWTHGGLSDDGLGKHLGRWSSPRIVDEGQRLVADFAFAKSAHAIKPDGIDTSAAEYLMSRAEEDPSSFGVSIVAALEPEELESGETVARLSADATKPVARGDFVADPAANPVGLHAGTDTLSALSEEATNQLDGIVKRLGEREARARAEAFLSRYFTRPGRESMPPKEDANTDELESLRLEVTRLRAESEGQRTALAALREAETSRKKIEADAYVSELRSKAVALGSPIPEDELKRVSDCFARGDDATARVLGHAYVSRSEALSAGSRKVTEVSLGTSSAQSEVEFEKAFAARKAAALGKR